MELNHDQEVIVIGCKGGYLAALIATIVGEKGRVNVLDPSSEVVDYTKERLSHWPTVDIRRIEDLSVAPVAFPGEFNRVIMTGQIEVIPEWVKSRISDGGFIVGNGSNFVLETAGTARTSMGLGTAAVLNTGTSAGNAIVLDGSARLPGVDGSQLTNLPSAGATAGFAVAMAIAL